MGYLFRIPSRNDQAETGGRSDSSGSLLFEAFWKP